MKAADVMTRKVQRVTPKTSVAEIVRMLITHRISAVPVVDAQELLVGMVSEADLLHRPETGTEIRRPWWLDLFADPAARAEAFLKAHGRTAEEVMSTDVETIAEDTPLDQVAKRMDERHIKRLPVLRDGRVVGIVARKDLIRSLAEAPREAPPPQLDDLEIRDRFERTARSAGFGSVGSVSVVVVDGRVQLWGLAATLSERKALEVAAAEIPGVRAVENNLAVRDTHIAAF